jgi:SprT-like protein
LHILKRGFQHRDEDFKKLLKQVGGTRFCRSLPIAKRTEPYRYKLICTSCRTEYMRKRKLDPKKYACGNCRGKLTLLKLDLHLHS